VFPNATWEQANKKKKRASQKNMKKKVDPKNRLNDLDSRQWLQFQKSWFMLEQQLPLDEFMAFFTKKEYPDGHRGTIGLLPGELHISLTADTQSSRIFIERQQIGNKTILDYAIYDARWLAAPGIDKNDWQKALAEICLLANALRENCYLTIIAKNIRNKTGTEAIAWQLANEIKFFLTQKDEKIACLQNKADRKMSGNPWVPDESILYFLNFRKENNAVTNFEAPQKNFDDRKRISDTKASIETNGFTDSWFIHRPPMRSKNVLLHPAKFPEDLIQKYIENFTLPEEWVFDPMAGTGSTIVAALESNRWVCGIELNPGFADIAQTRFWQTDKAILVTGDAADEKSYVDLPELFDYCITSPPYWDMLRMKGAETQAKRKKQGLQRWYSEDERDVGNIEHYEAFLDALEKIYKQVAGHLRPGRYMTIIVKNVKKKGTIYPLAWDIVERLEKYLLFCGEQLWCQDDQRLAPFGYRYVWVSNTFHHYCLTFRKPGEE
jgi:DNA modification methylase